MGNNFHHFSLCPEIIPKHHKKWKNQAVGGWNVEKIKNPNPKLFHMHYCDVINNTLSPKGKLYHYFRINKRTIKHQVIYRA